MELLKFIFSSFWVFVGFAILFSFALVALVDITRLIVYAITNPIKNPTLPPVKQENKHRISSASDGLNDPFIEKELGFKVLSPEEARKKYGERMPAPNPSRKPKFKPGAE